MADTRRHVFHGHAATISGRIVRVGEGKKAKFIKNAFIDVPAAALPTSGGRSSAKISQKQLTPTVVRSLVRFSGATASTEGVYDDAKGHFAATMGERAHSSLTATTRVRVDVKGLDIGLKNNVRMVIPRLRGGFTARSGTAVGDVAIKLDKDTGFDGNSVRFFDGQGKSYVLTVGVERDVFHAHDTFSAITAAAADAAFLSQFGHVLHASKAARAGAATEPPPLVRTDDGAVQGTIVKPISWKGSAFPGAEIDPDRPNTVSIPGFGRVFFGEIMLAPQSRRLTMVRVNLGSAVGGDVSAGDVMDNGSGSL